VSSDSPTGLLITPLVVTGSAQVVVPDVAWRRQHRERVSKMFYGNVFELAMLLFILGVLGPTGTDHASYGEIYERAKSYDTLVYLRF